MAASEIFNTPYNPADHERNCYEQWEQSGYFNPDHCVRDGITAPDAAPFSMVLPPPNVTGTLHMGHAAMLAVEDILVRFHRMKGYRTLWIPGTDSAAVATQAKVEQDLYKREKKTRYDLGREAFLAHVHQFAEESKNTILNQTRCMGSSLDWSRYAYTMDDERNHAVTEAFIRLYHMGLIYRGARIVNWDPKMQTTISDDEIEYVAQTDPFYYFKYGPFTIGTVRPETKFGDKYVVMHPNDGRYKEYTHGQQIEVEWINGRVTATVIKDEAVDPEMGSGVMTITPAHSAVDFEIAQRHNLDVAQVIDERGILLPIAGDFAGEHIKKARPKIVERMREKGLLVDVDETYTHNIATNSRGGGMIEPQVKEQWFVAVDKPFTMGSSTLPGIHEGDTVTLKQLMRTAVESGAVEIYPDRFKKIYFHWIENLHDWCISRQIWYGHRIPVWYRKGEMQISREAPGADWEQDPDTLDTWFSSGLWTFSTLGWPNDTDDLKTYHPTTVLETGYDILFFWVARMVLMSTALRGEVPFQNVYLHGIVRDKHNRKMSKSLGNIVDPLDMIKEFGADAVRMSLIVGAAPGNDLPLSEDKVRAYKKFANKLWNIARFVLDHADEVPVTTASYHAEDRAIAAQRDEVLREITQDIAQFRLYLAAEKAYHYVWHDFADVVLEDAKPVLNGNDHNAAAARRAVLLETLVKILKTLHPFMPHVTETIWGALPSHARDQTLLMVSRWPSE